MTCPTCKSPDCGVCTKCEDPHAQCLQCDDGLIHKAAPTSQPAQPPRKISAGTPCKTCGHAMLFHSAAGPCLFAAGFKGQSMLTPPSRFPKGWQHCKCLQFVLPDALATAPAQPPAPPADAIEPEVDDSMGDSLGDEVDL